MPGIYNREGDADPDGYRRSPDANFKRDKTMERKTWFVMTFSGR